MAVSNLWADDRYSALEARVARVESQGLVRLLERLDDLQQEVQQLRGETEEQNYRQDGAEQRQRDLYVDIDKRLGKIELQLQQLTATLASPSAVGSSPSADGSTDGSAFPTGPTDGDSTEPEDRIGSGRDMSLGAEQQGEQGSYDAAVTWLKRGRYAEAAEAFKNFLLTYPDGSLAANAQYWLSETYYVMGRREDAATEFAKVIDLYPNSTKTPDAWLKIGYIHYQQQNWARAHEILNQVTARYPDSAAAKLATERLNRMRDEGH